jgi:hypothetical protein
MGKASAVVARQSSGTVKRRLRDALRRDRLCDPALRLSLPRFEQPTARAHPCQDEDHSTNVFWLALPSLGEAWHRNHHAFPRSAFHGPAGMSWTPPAG